MKRLSQSILAVFLAVLMGMIPAVKAFAAETESPDYISKVKIFMGDCSAAEAEGFTLLKDGGDPVDLNQNAGGGIGSKGEKAVYLGYKTTKNRGEAITDLALMNMKGGYKTKDYETLMQQQMSVQIVPFVSSFMEAVVEYRENYNSEFPENKQRAKYIHSLLNKLTDDDCGGAGLGDLLLNETIYEMAKPRYDALSTEEKSKTSLYKVNLNVRDSLPASEKNKHADILTIVAQSNGNALLLLESLIARATDCNESTWIDRFCSLTYDNLVDATGLPPTDAKKELDKLYGDDANAILDMWDVFREQILNADESEAKLDKMNMQMSDEDSRALDEFDVTKATDSSVKSLSEAVAEAEINTEVFTNRLTDLLVKSFLENTEFEDGTLYDFFTMTKEEVQECTEELYTLVASLSKGQRATLDFITLSDFVVIGGTNADEYSDKNFENFEPISVYDGVNREIYKQGGVALTSDAIRSRAADDALNEETASFPIHWWTFVSGGLALSSAAAFGISLSKYFGYTNKINELNATITQSRAAINDVRACMFECGNQGVAALRQSYINGVSHGMTHMEYREIMSKMNNQVEELLSAHMENRKLIEAEIGRVSARSTVCKYLSVGFSVAMVVFSAITVYLAWQDIKSYYKVDVTPMPNYIIDEKDLIGYNKKGEKVVLKNQSAYYKLVECNRNSNDEYFSVLGTGSDLNGDVGRQWLALYAVKNDVMDPILASSLKVVVDNTQAPAGYETGIHMFGADAAFNLNSSLYDWNNDAESVYIYFQTDDTAASTTGSNFTAGTLALSGGAGLALGSVITALAMKTKKKSDKKESTAQ
ncbi:MAG: hypothetical protein IJT49_06525 [Clostridia bacterium]|nr:hypothetical protein [Clostridia bacterium]